jgi:hypothetical protein
MDFNIRAMSMVECIPAERRVDLASVLGKRFEFRGGLQYSLIMPSDAAQYARCVEPERVLTALQGWVRLFSSVQGKEEIVHVVAPSENEQGELMFYRLDLLLPQRHGKGPRPEAELISGQILAAEDCISWLIDLAESWDAPGEQSKLRFVLRRPSMASPTGVRVAWVIPEAVQDRSVRPRLIAVGKVLGAVIVGIEPRGYRDTAARLAKAAPYDAAVVCRNFAPHITAEAIPEEVPRELIHFCDSDTISDLERQIRVWIQIAIEEVELRRQEPDVDESRFLLALMIHAMLSHSKIGESNHCPRETVLKSVRGRRLNVPAAENALDQNCEPHLSTKPSNSLFLWKEHHDGRQFFLNPGRVEEMKTMVAQVLSK